MRPFRSRVMAAIVLAILTLGLLGTAANAAAPGTPSRFPEDPWGLGRGTPTGFPEDPWPGIN
jgi:hypothetical protein